MVSLYLSVVALSSLMDFSSYFRVRDALPNNLSFSLN